MATVADAAALREIYLPYVRTTAVTFELEDPTLEDFTERVRKTLERYPYIVAVEEGEIVGYAYASAFRPRAAYLHSIETSIYMRMDYRGKGVGRRLYETLAKLLVLQMFSTWKPVSLTATLLMSMSLPPVAFFTNA